MKCILKKFPLRYYLKIFVILFFLLISFANTTKASAFDLSSESSKQFKHIKDSISILFNKVTDNVSDLIVKVQPLIIRNTATVISPSSVDTPYVTSITPVISRSQKLVVVPKNVVPKIVNDQSLLDALRKLLGQKEFTDLLRGPQGLKGDSGPTSYQPSGPTSIPVSYAPIGIVQPNPSANFAGATFFRSTELSSYDFTTTNANIASLNVSGNSNLTGDLTVGGTITGNIAGTINPSFTLGSIPFQGATGLSQDNANLFWDNTNKRLGIGTTVPGAIIDLTRVVLQSNDLIGIRSDVSLDDGGDYNNNQYGGYFHATGSGSVNYSYGVYAVSDATNIDSDSIGVYGKGFNEGIFGESTTGVGVMARGVRTLTTTAGEAFNVSETGTYDTTGGAINAYGAFIETNSARGSGSNELTNIALYASATGAQKNYAAIFNAGKVGIGTTTPNAYLDLSETVSDNTQALYGIRSVTDFDDSDAQAYNHYAGYFEQTGVGSSNVNYGLYVKNSNTGLANASYGIYVTGGQFALFANTAANSNGIIAAASATNAGTPFTASMGKLSSFSNDGEKVVNVTSSSIYNTTGGAITHYGQKILMADARTAGSNPLTSVGLHVDVSGAQNNYAAIFENGNVGIGDTTPLSLLTVGSEDLFQVNSSGAIVAATGITSSGTITFSGLGGGGLQCVKTSNTGLLSAAACGVTTWDTISNPVGNQSLTFGTNTSAWTSTATTQTFLGITANSLTTGKILSIASSSLTSGALIDLAITGSGGLTNQKGINISLSGTNSTGAQTTYGSYISNTHTGTSNNVGIYSTASGGSNNYAAIFDQGNVLLGATSVSALGAKLEVTGKGYFTDELNIGSTTDKGTYALQTTGDSYFVGQVNITPANIQLPTGGALNIKGRDGEKGVVIRESDNAPGNILELQSGNGTTIFNATSTGYLTIASSTLVAPTGGMLNIKKTDGVKGIIVRAANNTISYNYEGQAEGGTTTFYVGHYGDGMFNMGLIVNEGGGDNDTRFESQHNQNMFYLDASTDRIGLGTATPATMLEIASSDLGSGSAGPIVTIGRNTNATTGAGSIDYLSKSGTHGYVWQDNSGILRINTSTPTNANDTAGTVVGAQSSSLDSKNILGQFSDYSSALSAIVDAPLYNFTYKSGAYNGQQFTGIITDYSPEFGMDKDAGHPAGKSLNMITGLGYTFGAIKELDIKIKGIESFDEPSNTFGNKLRTWLADVGNGIENIFAKKIHTEELCVKKSDGTEICVTGDTLNQLLNSQNMPSQVPLLVVPSIQDPNSLPSPDPTTTPQLLNSNQVIDTINPPLGDQPDKL